MTNVIVLESVDSCIDKDWNMYPLNCDGSPDFMITCHIDEMDKEFWDDISEKDAAKVVTWMTDV